MNVKDEFLQQALGRKLRASESWTDALARKYAKLHYPDAPASFVAFNKLVLAQQLENDYRCDTCEGKRIADCPTCGYKTYLKLDEDGGYCVPTVDAEPCGKILIDLPITDGARMGKGKGGRRE